VDSSWHANECFRNFVDLFKTKLIFQLIKFELEVLQVGVVRIVNVRLLLRMEALFISRILCLIASFEHHCFIKVLFYIPFHISCLPLNRQLYLDCLAELVTDQIAIIVQLIEVIDFKVCINMVILVIKDALELKALVLQHPCIFFLLMVHVEIIELDPAPAELFAKLILNNMLYFLSYFELRDRQQRFLVKERKLRRWW